MELLVDEAGSQESYSRKKGLEGLVDGIRKARGHLSVSNLSRFFLMLKERLCDTDWDTLNLSLQLIHEIIPVLPT